MVKQKESEGQLRNTLNNGKKIGNISIRIEDLLNGKDLLELTKIADESAYEIICNCIQRIETINKEINEKNSNFGESAYSKKYENFYIISNLLSKDGNEFTNQEKLLVFGEYKKICSICGPHEQTDKAVIEEEFSAKDVLSDKSIFNTALDRVKQYLKISSSSVPEEIKANQKKDFLIKKMTKVFNLSGLNFSDFNIEKDEIETILNQNLELDNELDERKRYSFAINKDVLFSRFEEICEVLNYVHSTGIQIDLVIDQNGKKPEGYNFNSRAPYSLKLDELIFVDNLNSCGLIENIYFSEFYEERNIPRDRDDMWTANEVIDANKNVYDYANEVQSLNLSPFEKLLFIQMRVAKTNYTGRKDNDEKTSTFLTAFVSENKQAREKMVSESKAYVCTGYACLAKAVIDAVSDNGLKSFVSPISFYYREDGRKKYGAKHAVDVVHLVDKKYGIDGYYVYDPTWSMSWASLDLSLIPVGDTKKFKDRYAIFDESKSSRIDKYLLNYRDEDISRVGEKNFVYDKYKNKSKPVEVSKFWDAIINIYNQVENSEYKSYYDDMEDLSAEEFANSKINESMRDLAYFYPESAENDFYRMLREYFKKHEEKYPDWKEKWETYANKSGYDYIDEKNL